MWSLWSHTPVSSDTRRIPGFSKAGFCSRQESHLTFQAYLFREKATANKQRVIFLNKEALGRASSALHISFPMVFVNPSFWKGPG